MFNYGLRLLAGAVSLCALSACGSGSGGSSGVTTLSASTEAESSPVLAESNHTSPVAEEEPFQTTLSTTATTDLTSFDFAGGMKLPAKAVLSVGNAYFRPGASVAYLPVRLDRATPNTVIARVITMNGGSGTTKAVSGYQYSTVEKVVIFRPGDPLVQTVAVPLLSSTNGQQFGFKLREAPWGADQGTASATVTASSTATPTPQSTSSFRAARRFAASGTLQFEMRKDTMKWGYTGGPTTWATQLSHGRTQTANGETGLYVDSSFSGIEAPIRYTDQGLVMHSQKLKSPISYGGASWNYGAVVLSAHNFPTAQIGYGQYEWVAKMPNRRGSWPALWLISTSGWPPEIDVYEGFGYQSYWDFDRHFASTIHGGTGGIRSFQRGVTIQGEQAYGITGLSQGFHRYAVDIQWDYITWFVDGMETYQSVNPFRGKRWYPIMNVAVKTTGAYNDGSGDMIVKSFRAYSD